MIASDHSTVQIHGISDGTTSSMICAKSLALLIAKFTRRSITYLVPGIPEIASTPLCLLSCVYSSLQKEELQNDRGHHAAAAVSAPLGRVHLRRCELFHGA